MRARIALALLGLLFAVTGSAQPVSDLNVYLGPDGAAYWDEQCRYRGTEVECAAITAEIEQRWVDSCPERTAPIPYGPLHIIRYRLDFEARDQGRSLAHAVEAWPACAGTEPEPDPDPPVPPAPVPGRTGPVRFVGNAFADDGGEFLGFGATCMHCLHSERTRRGWLRANLEWLGVRGVNYIRVLTVVDGPYWEAIDKKIDPNWPGYWTTFDDLFVDATEFGIRLNVVIFGDTKEYLDTPALRRDWVIQVASYLDGHRDQVQFAEIANESTGIDLPVAELAQLVELWRSLSTIPVAASAIYSTDDDLADYNGRVDPNEEGIGTEKFFQRFTTTTVDVLTPHFDRDYGDGGYRFSRQAWEVQWYDYVPTYVFVNNEPTGCGSSDTQTCEPANLVQDFLTTFISHGAGYTWHTGVGVRGLENYWDMPNAEAQMTAFRAMQALLPPDTANGINRNHHWPGHPYVDLNQIWPDLPSGSSGVVRAFAAEVDGRFYIPLMGLRNAYEMEAKWPMSIEVFSALDGTRLEIVELDQGQRHTFREVNGLRDFLHRVSRR